MIPRLRPPFSVSELLRSFLRSGPQSETAFEREFADAFGFRHALFFPYGRSAIFSLLKTLEWKNEDVAVPAYTCVVVPHAITLSGNRVTYIDCGRTHFNVPSEHLSCSINSKTRMVALTPIFGYPIENEKCSKVIRDSAPDVFVLYDEGHACGSRRHDYYDFRNADGVLFSLGSSKVVSSLYGGVLLLKSTDIFKALKQHRDSSFSPARRHQSLQKLFYGFAVWAAFREPVLTLTNYLESQTKLLDNLTVRYYGTSGISLPCDVEEMPSPVQAALGSLQLRRHDGLIEVRRRIGTFYERRLKAEGLHTFEWPTQPTYSHFPLAVKARSEIVKHMKARGVQLGVLIDYACPDLPGYEQHCGTCPNATFFGHSMVNLPNWPGLTERQLDYILDCLCRCRDRCPELFYGALELPNLITAGEPWDENAEARSHNG